MSKPVILTGLRSNNDLHIGNYLGALLPIVDMANQQSANYQVNLFVPDLHSFTTPVNHHDLYRQTLRNLNIYIAAGLQFNKDNIYLYRQSYIPAHSQLTWILDCFTYFGEMRRMIQFKEKSTQLTNSEESVSVGLFNYPVLMAADILLYGACYVPVGDDQTQHLEFTRDIAERMNKQFGNLFVVPLPVAKQHAFFGKDQGLRIRDLVDPSKKMSKSAGSDNGVIFLSDDPELARKKVLKATTDSFQEIKYDYRTRPGVSNLLDLLALLTKRKLSEVLKFYQGQTTYGPLKQEVANAVVEFLKEFQDRLKSVDGPMLLKKVEQDEVEINNQANITLLKVERAVGLRNT